MATKPTVSTEWAIDAAALKEQPDGAQRDFGWSTSDNTINGTPVKPNLQNQNAWQSNVHDWFQYFDEVAPGGDTQDSIDLWQWDTSDVVAAGGFDPYLDTIEEDSGNLVWRYTDGSFVDDWTHNKADIYTAARYWEIRDMLGNGIGIRMVDGADVIWTVVPNWQTISAGDVTMLNSISTAASNSINMTLTAAGPPFQFFTIIKDDGGVITTPDDFTGFSALTSANFYSKNTNGVRAILIGDKAVAYSYAAKSPSANLGPFLTTAARQPRRKWYRPIVVGNSAISCADVFTAGRFDAYVELDTGKVYRVTMQCPARDFTVGSVSPIFLKSYAERGSSRSTDRIVAQPVVFNTDSGTLGATGLWVTFEFLCPDFGFARDVSFDGLLGLYGSSVSGEAKFFRNDIAQILIEEM